MRLTVFALTLAFAFSALAVDSEPWRNANYKYRQKFTFTAAASTCPQFPLAIVVNATYFKIAKANLGTKCWTIYDQDGNRWNGEEVAGITDDGTYKIGEFHASLSTFDLYTAKTALWLYYDASYSDTTYTDTTGNTGAKAVWDKNTQVVFHCQEANGNLVDSTSNGASATANGTPTYGTTGSIGKAVTLTATSPPYDYWTGLPDVIKSQSEITVSMWVNPTTGLGVDAAIFSYAYLDDGYWQFDITPAAWYTRDSSTGLKGARNNDITWSAISQGSWHHIFARYSVAEGKKEIFLDGKSAGSSTTSIDAITNTQDYRQIGLLSIYAAAYRYIGSHDEIRIASGIARSTDWGVAERNNGLAGNGLTLDGSEQEQPSGYTGWPHQILDKMRGGAHGGFQ